jgi:hypothetical protein
MTAQPDVNQKTHHPISELERDGLGRALTFTKAPLS